MTASGAGVNLKLMPDADGAPVVPMRESFAFDPIYAQCIVEDNAERFAMDTFEMGRVVIEPHQFFMAMYADTVGLHEIRENGDGSRTATLLGASSARRSPERPASPSARARRESTLYSGSRRPTVVRAAQRHPTASPSPSISTPTKRRSTTAFSGRSSPSPGR